MTTVTMRSARLLPGSNVSRNSRLVAPERTISIRPASSSWRCKTNWNLPARFVSVVPSTSPPGPTKLTALRLRGVPSLS